MYQGGYIFIFPFHWTCFRTHIYVKNPSDYLGGVDFTGADGRIRTCDLLITNELLYQLSYIGILHK